MALRDQYPVIDDRRYADLVAEARTRIPRYTPEWTDLNENEPGMAIVELFGWMTELLTYRLGKVPKLNYLKFLELVGIEMTPAVPATAEVVLPMLPTFAAGYTIVPARTQLSAQPPGSDAPVVFETERSLTILAAQLDAVQIDTGFEVLDASAANAAADIGFRPFGANPRPGAALMLGFDSAFAFPAVTIDLMVWIQTRAARGPLVARAGDAPPPPVTLQWEFWDGKDWRALDAQRDDTAAFSRSGHVVLSAPPANAFVKTVRGKIAAPRYWLRARLVDGAYQTAPEVLALRTNTATVRQAQSVDAEILGRSNGRPDQVFAVANAPVVNGSLVLEVDEGEGFVAWNEVADFYVSGPDDIVYVLNRTTGEVRFGNGRQGRIPVANPARPSNIVARRYRFGGGAAGNVGANAIDTLRGGIAGVDAGRVRNPFPAFGGSDEESFDAVTRRAAASLKSNQRAVTVGDFELHAIAAGGIARAKALPLHHPLFAGIEVPGVVSVIVVPQPRDEADLAPMPTDGTLRQVCRYLDTRRLATTELYVIAPRYVAIVVTATLVCRDDADLAQVRTRAQASLQRWLHAIDGGDDSSLEATGSGWPFGGPVYFSVLLQRLMVEGVRRVESATFTLDGRAVDPCRDGAIPPNALLIGGAHAISVAYEARA